MVIQINETECPLTHILKLFLFTDDLRLYINTSLHCCFKTFSLFSVDLEVHKCHYSNPPQTLSSAVLSSLKASNRLCPNVDGLVFAVLVDVVGGSCFSQQQAKKKLQ